eukprot:m51a1_g1644 hypothetical protein (338) ;mRNA; f:331752-333435
MKLELNNADGRPFYVFKPWLERAGDPEPERAALALMRGRMYSAASLDRLHEMGAILRPPFAEDIILVAKDAPRILGGSEQGFWKLLQRRLRLKHASRALDRNALPVLKDVELWLRDISGADHGRSTGQQRRSFLRQNSDSESAAPGAHARPGAPSPRSVFPPVLLASCGRTPRAVAPVPEQETSSFFLHLPGSDSPQPGTGFFGSPRVARAAPPGAVARSQIARGALPEISNSPDEQQGAGTGRVGRLKELAVFAATTDGGSGGSGAGQRPRQFFQDGPAEESPREQHEGVPVILLDEPRAPTPSVSPSPAQSPVAQAIPKNTLPGIVELLSLASHY